MIRTKLIVGALALALPVAAVAGCGVEKRRTIKAELASAGQSLQHSKAVSVTLRLDDHDGNLLKAAADAEGAPPRALVAALFKSSITVELDPAGAKTLQQLQVKGQSEADLKTAIKDVNFSLSARDDQAVIGELRLVDGTLYAHVDLAEVNRLVTIGGGDPIDAGLDDAFNDNPTTAKALADVRAGKWLKLPIADYIDKFKDLAKSFTPNAPPEATKAPDFQALSGDFMKAIKPFIKVTDANNNSADRVLNVSVHVRPALKAALAVLQASKDLPFASALKDIGPATIDKNVSDGTARGTITLKNSHFTQFAVDLESVRTLSTDPGTKTVAGSRVVIDVNDAAQPVIAPTNVSSFDIGEMLDSFLSDVEGRQAA